MARRNSADESETSAPPADPAQAEVGSETAAETTPVADVATEAEGASEPSEADRATAAERGEIASGGTSEQSDRPDHTAQADVPAADASRTGFVTGVRPGEQCICPDGRKGTVHKFDEGLVCIPNHDQG